MDLSPAERIVLARYREKTDMAGGAKAGYVLRRAVFLSGSSDLDGGDLDTALERLVERGLLAPNEASDFFFLTETGVEALSG